MKKRGNVVLLLAMLAMFAVMSIGALAQTAEGDEIINRGQSGVDEILRVGTALFWIVFVLIVVAAGVIYAMHKDDPNARQELISKIKGWGIGCFIVALATTIVSFFRGVWG